MKGKLALIIIMTVLLAAVAPLAMAQDANRVEVGLIEYEINMPASIPAGPTVFEVTNNGTAPHNFEIEGQGIERVFEVNLQPGETQTMEVDLVPGSYTVYCPVGNHRQMGMELQLSVTEAEMAQATPEMAETPAATPQTDPAAQATETPAPAEPAPAAEATATPAVATLPQAGGTLTPWASIMLLVAGGGLVLAGFLALALSRR